MNVFLKKSMINPNPFLNFFRKKHWLKDFKPGSQPITERDRINAANKYGIHPTEYEMYPAEEQVGDYPKLPDISTENRDPFYPWDDPALKRNYKEMLHEDYEFIREDRYNVNARLHMPLKLQVLQTVTVIGCFMVVYYILEHVKMFHALTPKQYPIEGVTHYTFDSVGEQTENTRLDPETEEIEPDVEDEDEDEED